MARVTIEGSITPSTYLPRGQRMTVERTGFINKLIRKGYATVVDEPDKVVEISRETDRAHVAAKLEKQIEAPASEDEAAPVPARNASTEEWASFLESEGVPFKEGATRADLIAAWDEAFPDAD